MRASVSRHQLLSSTLFHLLLIFLAALIVYYPVLPGQIIFIDDLDMMKGLAHAESYDIMQLFLPRSQHGQYFRPLIGVSFLFDRFVLNGDPWLMHLENLLFHAVNGVLVYLATCLALRSRVELAARCGVSLLAALFFVVHPLATESVSWLSGRTDLLAGCFILISLLAALEYRHTARKRLLLAAFLFILFALLVKESAVGFLFGILFILCADAGEEQPCCTPRHDRYSFLAVILSAFLLQLFTFNTIGPLLLLFAYGCYLAYATGLFARKRREIGLLLLLFLGAILLFIVIRRIAFASSVGRISDTMKLIYGDISYSFHLFLTGFGFYTKKFFFPLPLNFAIREIDPLYALLGLVVVFLIIRRFFVNSLANGLIMAGYSLIIPALALTFGTIAWTAYAERYLYMTIAFWIVAGAIMLVELLEKRTATVQRGAVVLLVVLLFFFTFYSHLRAKVWCANESLFADTVAKSPRFRMAYEAYMAALVDQKKFDKAREMYSQGVVQSTVQYEPLLDVLLAQVAAAEGKQQEAIKIYGNIVRLHKDRSSSPYRFLNDFLATVASKGDGRSEHDIKWLILQNQKRIVAIDHDPFDSYLLGKLYLTAGRRADAADAFGAASAAAQPGSFYLPAAKLLQNKLTAN